MIYFIKLFLFRFGIIKTLPVSEEYFEFDKVELEKTNKEMRGEE